MIVIITVDAGCDQDSCPLPTSSPSVQPKPLNKSKKRSASPTPNQYRAPTDEHERTTFLERVKSVFTHTADKAKAQTPTSHTIECEELEEKVEALEREIAQIRSEALVKTSELEKEIHKVCTI